MICFVQSICLTQIQCLNNFFNVLNNVNIHIYDIICMIKCSFLVNILSLYYVHKIYAVIVSIVDITT